MKQSNVSMGELEALSLVKSVSSKEVAERRGKIESLETAMLQEEQLDIPVTHRFSGGIYAREITIPAGTMLTGRIHKLNHFDIMLSGDVTVSTDSGEVKRLTGLNIMEGKSGKKRAGYAHSDTHWITFHAADERDPEEMFEFLTCGTFKEFERFTEDYEQALLQIAMDEKALLEHAKTICSKGDLCQ